MIAVHFTFHYVNNLELLLYCYLDHIKIIHGLFR